MKIVNIKGSVVILLYAFTLYGSRILWGCLIVDGVVCESVTPHNMLFTVLDICQEKGVIYIKEHYVQGQLYYFS